MTKAKYMTLDDLQTVWNNKMKPFIQQQAGSSTQEQADWNQSDNTADDYIKNKPTNVSAFTNDAGYLTQHQSLDNYYTKTEVNGLVDTPHQEYVTVDAYASLPDPGSTDTVYRVSGWDGSANNGAGVADDTVYSEYAWNGTQYIFLCVKSQIGEVFDISVYNNNAKYADLAAALNGGANIPQSLQKGGMSVKFVQNSDNKYVKYFLTSTSWSTNVDDWQGVDDVPTKDSHNLVESGGVFDVDELIRYGNKIGGIEYKFEKTNKYMDVSTIGSTAQEGSASGRGYIVIPVVAGDYFTVLSKGSSSAAREWAFTDSELKVLSNTDNTSISLPEFIKAEQNGYLIVNNSFSSFENPQVMKITDGVSGNISLNINGYITNKTIGTKISYSYLNSWRSCYIPLVAGQKATIYTYGGGNGRAWSILTEGNIVESVSEADIVSTFNPIVVYATKTCILVVNDDYTKFSSPKVVVTGKNPCLTDITELETRITEIENAQQREIKILAIGNSFTENALDYMGDFLADMYIPNVTIYRVNHASSTVEYWWNDYFNNNEHTPHLVAGNAISNIGNTLKTIFAHDWDYIVFQQYSPDSDDYTTIEPYFCNLIAHVKKLCTNPLCKIAWQLTWSWASSASGTAPKGLDGYNSIVSVVEDILDFYRGAGIDVVIPSGSAIQNARGTTLNNEAELTKDLHHAAAGVAKYIICATWYKSLIETFTKKNVMSSTLTVSATPSSSDLGAESVTAENRNLCLMCVEYAVANPYHVSTIVE